MTEWISFQENNTPPEYDWVLVCTNKLDYSHICFARWLPTTKVWEFFNNQNFGPYAGHIHSCIGSDEVTHWMPLPKPP